MNRRDFARKLLTAGAAVAVAPAIVGEALSDSGMFTRESVLNGVAEAYDVPPELIMHQSSIGFRVMEWEKTLDGKTFIKELELLYTYGRRKTVEWTAHPDVPPWVIQRVNELYG